MSVGCNGLLIDAGNSAIKWATVVRGELQKMSSLFYVSGEMSFLLTQEIRKKYPSLEFIIISNVAGMLMKEKLTEWCQGNYDVLPVFPQVVENFCGLNNTYKTPSQLGVDRWLALIAAIHSRVQSGIICVVDCGTAVTIDSIDESNSFVGGVILPGLHTMQQSLSKRADAIGVDYKETKNTIFALNTAQGVESGVMLAITGAIEKVINELKSQKKHDVVCVFTGGDAKKIIPYLSIPVLYADDLVLQGLYLWGSDRGLGT